MSYTLYCANPECPTRIAGELHPVASDDIPDDGFWLCPACRSLGEWKVEKGDGYDRIVLVKP